MSPKVSFRPVGSFYQGAGIDDEDRIALTNKHERVIRSPRDTPEQKELIAEQLNKLKQKKKQKAEEDALAWRTQDESRRERERQRRRESREIRPRSKFDQDSMGRGKLPPPT